MSGHSKWHNIQHRKGRQDAKRGKLFTKAAKEIILAAKDGGGDPNSNNALRAAIAAAKVVNLPKDKIDNAIKKGTGELDGGEVFDIYYEGYGPGGVAMYVEAVTDNKNRTVAEVRHILSKAGGSMGEAGCVAWMFEKKGVLYIAADKGTEEQIMEVGLEAGAEDVIADEDGFEVRVAPADYMALREAFETAGIEVESAELRQLPQNTIDLDVDGGRKLVNLIDRLEDNDDVQNVYHNAELPEELLEEMDAE